MPMGFALQDGYHGLLMHGQYPLAVIFIEGNRDKPRYFGNATNIEGSRPEAYDGKPTTQVIFEAPNGKGKMVYNEIKDVLSLLEADQSLVRGEDLRAYLDSVVTSFGTHTHPETGATTLPPISGLPSVGDTVFSKKIKGT